MKITIELDNEDRDELQYMLDGRFWASVVEAIYDWAKLADSDISPHQLRCKIEENLKNKGLSTFG